MASSSAGMIVQPQVNSMVLRGEERLSRWPMRSRLASAPSTRTMTLRRNREGTCFRAAASTYDPHDLRCAASRQELHQRWRVRQLRLRDRRWERVTA